MQHGQYTPEGGQWTSISCALEDGCASRWAGRDYEAARLAMADGLLQSVLGVLWMVQQADGAGV